MCFTDGLDYIIEIAVCVQNNLFLVKKFNSSNSSLKVHFIFYFSFSNDLTVQERQTSLVG